MIPIIAAISTIISAILFSREACPLILSLDGKEVPCSTQYGWPLDFRWLPAGNNPLIILIDYLVHLIIVLIGYAIYLIFKKPKSLKK